MSGNSMHSTGSLLPRFIVFSLAIALALIHVFITFRGLSSPAGMEQAQLAREMARGHGYQTKVLRPHAWARLIQAGSPPAADAMPEITQPPLQPLLLAPLFKLLEKWQTYDPAVTGSIYLLDRVVACLGVFGLLLALLWTHGTARLLFDEAAAGVTVLVLILCEPLWALAVSGSPIVLLLPLFALCVRLIVAEKVIARQGKGSALGASFGIALTAGLMVLTHVSALWLLPGIVLVLILHGHRTSAALTVLLPLALLGGLGFWVMQRCGEPLGGIKPFLLAHLLPIDPSILYRDFSLNSQPVQLDSLLRKVLVNYQLQGRHLWEHLGYVFPALMFIPALFHRFKRTESSEMKVFAGCVFASSTLGMAMLGLPAGAEDDASLFPVLIPLTTLFGTAMLAVLWNRMMPDAGTFWKRQGHVVILLALSSLPLLNELPAQIKLGLTLKNRLFPHWPPYAPDRVFILRKLLEPREMVFADAPWFVAWYADVPAAWIPMKREDYPRMKEQVEASGCRVAGFVITPLSSKTHYLHEIFSGPYREWSDLVYRGMIVALDTPAAARADFEFKVAMPLITQMVAENENKALPMAFYTDRPRKLRE